MNLFSPEDKEKILQVINNKTADDLLQWVNYLCKKISWIYTQWYYKFLIVHWLLKSFLQRYSITKKHAQKLESYRENNGLFKSLDDLPVWSMNNKWIYNFYKSIIYGKERKIPKKNMSNLVVTPQSTRNNHKVYKKYS